LDETTLLGNEAPNLTSMAYLPPNENFPPLSLNPMLQSRHLWISTANTWLNVHWSVGKWTNSLGALTIGVKIWLQEVF